MAGSYLLVAAQFEIEFAVAVAIFREITFAKSARRFFYFSRVDCP